MTKPSLSTQGLFITGTDTGVGKTMIGSQLVRYLYNHDILVQPRKPIESGCIIENNSLQPQDGLQYYHAVDCSISLETITPYRLVHALSPERAARLENKSYRLNQLIDAVNKDLTDNSYPVIEGAGGFYSPLVYDGKNADLAKHLQLPVLLVAADRLGCLNHVLLTLEAIQHNNLKTIAIILNKNDNHDTNAGSDNHNDLKHLTNIPILAYPFTDHHNSSTDQNIVALVELL